MYIAIPNPNIVVPLEKMTITLPDNNNKSFQVLYNPESYVQEREVQYSGVKSAGGLNITTQFASSGRETLSFKLFFDSLSAGGEVGGTITDQAAFSVASVYPSPMKVDVRDYTKKVTDLMLVVEKLHRPPVVKLKWSKLQFYGFLVKCKQEYVKFNELGVPVRAWLHCVFQAAMSPELEKKLGIFSPGSPDTTKYHTVCQGDSLWSMAVEAYGQPEQWRLIADANDIANPRRLRSGELMRMPAKLK